MTALGKRVHTASDFEEKIGYARAVIVDPWVFVSGTTGFNYNTAEISEDVIEQTEQCFKNIIDALHQAGSSLEEIVKVTYILPNGEDFESIWPTLSKYFGDVRPAATMISAGLAEPRMKIEIEVTALKRA